MRLLLSSLLLLSGVASGADIKIKGQPVPLSGLNFTSSCSSTPPSGVQINTTAYFLPPQGSTGDFVAVFDTVSADWKPPISVNPKLGFTGATLQSASFAAVGPFLVLSGGGTSSVLSYDVHAGTWEKHKQLKHNIKRSCSVGCEGYFITSTGDFSKSSSSSSSEVQVGKPSDRQIYRYNLTSGEVFEINEKKERGGAGCGCSPADNRAFFAGGESDGGVSDNVAGWGVNPFHRGGEPVFGMSASRRDVGARVCNGMFAVVGGQDKKKKLVDFVDVWPSNMTAASVPKPVTFKLSGGGLINPQVGCAGPGGRYFVVSGGRRSDNTCSNKVYVFDSTALPAVGATLAASNTDLPTNAASVASSSGGTAGGDLVFFDGASATVVSIVA